MSTKTSVVKHAFSGTTIPTLFQSIQERVTVRPFSFTKLALKLNREYGELRDQKIFKAYHIIKRKHSAESEVC